MDIDKKMHICSEAGIIDGIADCTKLLRRETGAPLDVCSVEAVKMMEPLKRELEHLGHFGCVNTTMQKIYDDYLANVAKLECEKSKE